MGFCIILGVADRSWFGKGVCKDFPLKTFFLGACKQKLGLASCWLHLEATWRQVANAQFLSLSQPETGSLRTLVSFANQFGKELH